MQLHVLISVITLLLSILHIPHGSNALPQSSTGKPQYILTMPKKLLEGKSHTLSIQVSQSPTRLRLFIPNANWTKDYLLKTQQENVVFEIPSEIKRNSVNISLELNATSTKANIFDVIIVNSYVVLQILRPNFIIIAETSKPIYKPGELVQFRLLPVLIPHLKAPAGKRFSFIKVEDPEKTLVYQKKNVEWKDAMNLTFQLQPDTKLGKWLISATLDNFTEEHSFEVKKYVLPKFTVDVKVPSHVSRRDPFYNMEVCAQYGTGKPMKGVINSQVKFVPFYTTKHPMRLNFTNVMEGSQLCHQVKVPLPELLPKSHHDWYGEVNSTVEVIEDGTRENVQKNLIGPSIEDQAFKLLFSGPPYFKRNLPYYFTVKRTTLDDKPAPSTKTGNKGLRIEIGNYYQKYQRFYLHPQSNGEYHGMFLDRHNQSYITIYVVEESADKSENNPLSTEFTIHQWKSGGNDSIQIIPLNESNIQCDDVQGADIQVILQSTFPIKGEELTAHIMSQGSLFIGKMELSDQEPMECEDRDDQLGHYICLPHQYSKDGLPLIKCLPGYTGANCLDPICANNCSGHGICATPDLCLCHTGFQGPHCEICIRREGCEHGDCKEGNDCVCRPGYSGYWCNKKATFYDLQEPTKNPPSTTFPSTENVSTTNKFDESPRVLRRTVFQRRALLRLREEMGADIHLAVSLIRENINLNFSEIIADSAEIPGTRLCLETQKKTNSSFYFSRERAEPGSSVGLTLSPPDLRRSHCSLRISDVTLKNFGTSGGVSLATLLGKLIELNHKITREPNYDEVNPYSDIYRSNCMSKYSGFYHPYHMPWRSGNEDSASAFRSSGLLILSNMHYVFRDCGGYQFRAEGLGPFLASSERSMPMIVSPQIADKAPETQLNRLKARIREFFPETWRFDYLKEPQESQINLTVPDSMTTWNADAYCMTPQGLWIGNTVSLTVGLPFYIEPSLPYSIKKGETLMIPVKVLSYIPECFEISLSLSVPSEHLAILDAPRKTLCICGENTQETVFFRTRAVIAGRGKIEVSAHSTMSDFCAPDEDVYMNSDEKPTRNMFEAQDAVRKDILVEHEGIPTETVYSDVVCIQSNDQSKIEEVWTNSSFKWNTEKMVPGSLRVYIHYGADLVGPTLSNLGKLVQMPYGCGEQNMISMVPSIYALDYLDKTGSQDAELMETAKRYISIGYNRQLQYQHADGSFSAFGKNDKSGSTWLTAFVLRSFIDAQKHVAIIGETVLNSTREYLRSKQDKSGCFIENGTVLSSGIKGAMHGKQSLQSYLLTAYILASLTDTSPVPIRRGFLCLETIFFSKGFNMSTLDSYSLALLSNAYATHRPRSENFQQLTSELWKRRVEDGSRRIYFSMQTCSEGTPCGQGSIETTAYAYLALQHRADLLPMEKKMRIIRWLNSQRNSFGGYYSTQDTIVALKAISKFSEHLTAFSTTNLQLRLTGRGHYTKVDQITEESKLVTRKWRLPLPETMSSGEIETHVLARGSGCMVQQSVFLYNTFDPLQRSGVQPLKVSERSLTVSPDCQTNVILVCISWSGNPSASGSMMLLQVKALSGWTLTDSQPWEGMEKNRPKLIENQQDMWNYYFDGFSEDVQERCLKLTFHQSVEVADMKPSTIVVTDYYKPEIKHEILYTFTVCGTKKEQVTEAVTTEAPTTIPPKPEPVQCPVFHGWNESVNQVMLQTSFYERSCSNYLDFMLAVKKSNEQRWIFYRVLGKQFVEWEEELHLSRFNSCMAGISQLDETVLITGTSWLFPEPGSPVKLDDMRGEVWSAKRLGHLLLVDTKGRCERAVKFARMLKRLKSRLSEVDEKWAPLQIQLVEWQCPLHVKDPKTVQLPKKFQDFLCFMEDGNYYSVQLLSNVTAFNISNPYHEWRINISRVPLRFPTNQMKTIVLPNYQEMKNTLQPREDAIQCAWLSSAKTLFLESRKFVLLTAKPEKIYGDSLLLDGDFAFLDQQHIKEVMASTCTN